MFNNCGLIYIYRQWITYYRDRGWRAYRQAELLAFIFYTNGGRLDMTSPSSATHATRTAESPHNARSNSSLKGINQISCNAGEEPKFFVLTLGKAGGPCGTFLPPCIRYHLTSLAYSRWYGSPKKICRCWHMVLLEECVMISLMNID